MHYAINTFAATIVTASAFISQSAIGAELSSGPSAPMQLSQGDFVELKMNLECVARGAYCEARVVGGVTPRPYVLISVFPIDGMSEEKLAMEALMYFYREFGRFTWASQVVLDQQLTAGKYRLARVSLVKSGAITPYRDVYRRITWQSRDSAFLPGIPGDAFERIPESSPWKN